MTPTETSCPQCGRALSHEPRFCSFCGHRLESPTADPTGTGPASPARNQTSDNPGAPGGAREGGLTPSRQDGYAVASVACGVAGLFAAPILGPVLAIVFGNRARDRLARDPGLEGAGLARAGTTLGWVGLAISAIVLVVGIALMSSLASRSDAGDTFSTPPCPVVNPWPGVRIEGCESRG